MRFDTGELRGPYGIDACDEPVARLFVTSGRPECA
jgi:hypothetical protein